MTGCYDSNYGGAIYQTGGELTINSDEFASSALMNNTITWGGAIYQSNGKLWLDAVTLTGNESTWGGGLYLASGSATLTENTKIFDNAARNSYGKPEVDVLDDFLSAVNADRLTDFAAAIVGNDAERK